MAVMSGEVNIHFGSFSSTLPFVRANRLRALALTGPMRSTEAPELPTMQEEGFPGFDVRSWFAILAPSATPKAIVTRHSIRAHGRPGRTFRVFSKNRRQMRREARRRSACPHIKG